jgi:hypothetical protein
LDQPERALSIHCRTRTHLQRYVRYRDDRALRSRAEKIHHRKEAAKENAVKEAEAKKSLEEKTEGQDEVSYFQNFCKTEQDRPNGNMLGLYLGGSAFRSAWSLRYFVMVFSV